MSYRLLHGAQGSPGALRRLRGEDHADPSQRRTPLICTTIIIIISSSSSSDYHDCCYHM